MNASFITPDFRNFALVSRRFFIVVFTWHIAIRSTAFWLLSNLILAESIHWVTFLINVLLVSDSFAPEEPGLFSSRTSEVAACIFLGLLQTLDEFIFAEVLSARGHTEVMLEKCVLDNLYTIFILSTWIYLKTRDNLQVKNITPNYYYLPYLETL